MVLGSQFIHLILKGMLKSSPEHCLVPMRSRVHSGTEQQFHSGLFHGQAGWGLEQENY